MVQSPSPDQEGLLGRLPADGAAPVAAARGPPVAREPARAAPDLPLQLLQLLCARQQLPLLCSQQSMLGNVLQKRKLEAAAIEKVTHTVEC